MNISISDAMAVLAAVIALQAITVALVIYLHSKYDSIQKEELQAILHNTKRIEYIMDRTLGLVLTLRTVTQINASRCYEIARKVDLTSGLPGLRKQLMKQNNKMARDISGLMLLSPDIKLRLSAMQYLENSFGDYRGIILLREVEALATGDEKKMLQNIIERLDRKLRTEPR